MIQVFRNTAAKYLLGSFLVLACSQSVSAQKLTADNLKCEYKRDPAGVDNKKPKLSWQLHSSGVNIIQTAYRVIVSDDPSFLEMNRGNIWDSKKVLSRTSLQVSYHGKTLLPAKKYYWKVMVWDNKGNVSSWSDNASWQMGLLSADDWRGARWLVYEDINDTAIIAPHVNLNGKRSWGARRDVLPLMRKEFTITKDIKRATAFICGLGQFELNINGKKIGDHFLDPGWTNYKKQALYVTFDITNNIRQGRNAVGVMLGNGFYYIPGQRYRKMTGAYGLPKMIMRAIIEYTDGSSDNIVSDQSWQMLPSPIIFSSIYGGEDYDATKEQPGWDEPDFHNDGLDWFDVTITTGPANLESQMAEPIKVMQRFSYKNKRQLTNFISVYDLGQNFSGIPAIKVKGNSGDTVRIIPAELLNDDGTANQRATGSPAYFTYVLNGKDDESWQPRFSYYGFRYLEVHCIPKEANGLPPNVINVEGLHVRNAASTIGSFESSNNLFNQINTLIDWAIKSNTVSLFTDCPHREKLGWLEQTQLMGSSVQYNYDIATLNRKVIRDMMFAQYENGKIPEIAPEFTVFTAPFDESPEWGSASVILPWYDYQWYGDRQTLEESYPMMKGYVNYLRQKSKDHILSHGLGDWFDIGPGRPGVSQMTKMGITATATYYYDLSIMERVARLFNKAADSKKYQQEAAAVKKAFNEKFFDKVNLKYDSASQAANAMALYMNLAEPKYRDQVLNALVKDIRSRDNALTAGDIGYRYVLRALEEAGRSDMIFDMNARDDVPGYGYQVKHGATALTESWQALPNVSNNHFMLGHLMEWFYSGLAGIQLAKDGVAYDKIEIIPTPVGDVRHASANYASPYGMIRSEWTKQDARFELKVEVPANTTATIFLPAGQSSTITMNNKKVKAVPYSGIGERQGRMMIKIGSGNYAFEVKNNLRP